MQRSTSLLAAIGCAILGACSTRVPPDGPILAEDVRKSLQTRHPARDHQVAGELQFEEDARLVELSLPHLSRGLSGARFYRTEFRTGYYEYLRAEAVIMARRVEGRLDIFECLSPVFTAASGDFLGQFRGLRADAGGGRESIGEEIGRLFESITYKGSLHDGHLCEGRYTVELRHHETTWRMIVVEFDPGGSVKAVELKHPREPSGR